MKHFYIIANPQKDKELALTRQIKNYIEEHGGSCVSQMNQEYDIEEIFRQTECILVVGGDGTLLRAARDMAECNIPLIGVNTGHVGYLCELDAGNVMNGLEILMEEQGYSVEQRMLLTGYLVNKSGCCGQQVALNDIVIHRSGALQMVDFIISVNGEYLNTYSADGIIIATPTGSTAYNMSAGGPIVDPRAELILITPISPHTLNAKSIVLGADAEITVEIAPRRIEKDEKAEVSFDGEHVGMLTVGERIVVKKAGTRTRILKLSKLSFLERLGKKLQGYIG